MYFTEADDRAYGADYTYRQARSEVRPVNLPGYEHELYDGSDEADPFRVETPREMREKINRNDLLPPGHVREDLRAAAVEAAEADDVSVCTAVPGGQARGRYIPPQRRTRGRNVAARKLDLHAILTDVSIQNKYKFTPMQLAEIRAVREECVATAVGIAQEMLVARDFSQTEVVSGTVGQFTKAEAVNELAYLAGTRGARSCVADSKVVSTSIGGDKLHILSGLDTMGCEYEHEWEIVAPIGRAKSALDYYKLLVSLGYDECYSCAGPAAATLGITVVHNTVVRELPHPTVKYHAANCTSAAFDVAAFERVEIGAVVPKATVEAIGAINNGGQHCAYTVAIAGSGRFINDHIRAKALSAKFKGKELRKFQTFRLAGELWFFYDTSDAGKPPSERAVAATRPPKMGEVVRLLLPDRDLTGNTCLLGPPGAIVPSSNGTWTVEQADFDYAQYGMSGLPYISVEDGAVVAIHEGVTQSRLRLLAVPANVACDMVVEQAVSCSISYSVPGTQTIAQVELDAKKTRKQYRANVAAVVESLDHMDDRTMLSCYGKKCYVGGRSGPLAIPGCKFGLETTGAVGRVSHLPLRAPVDYERLLIVGRNNSGIFCSPVLSMGSVVADGLFTIELGGDFGVGRKDFFNGAVVMAVEDACIVGFVSAQGVVSYGTSDYTLMCWTCNDDQLIRETSALMSRDPVTSPTSDSGTTSSGMFSFGSVGSEMTCGPASLTELRASLDAMFPGIGFNDVEMFTDSDMDEVFSHPSLKKYGMSRTTPYSANRYWARQGDSALSYLIMQEMRKSGVLDSEATINKAKVQSNERQAHIASSLGLEKLYFFRAGANISIHDKADLLEAVLGWVVEVKGLASKPVKDLFVLLQMNYSSVCY